MRWITEYLNDDAQYLKVNFYFFFILSRSWVIFKNDVTYCVENIAFHRFNLRMKLSGILDNKKASLLKGYRNGGNHSFLQSLASKIVYKLAKAHKLGVISVGNQFFL